MDITDIKCLLPVPQYVGVGGCCCKAGIDLLIEFFSVNFTSPFLKKNCLSYTVTVLTFASFVLSVAFIIVS